MKPPARPAVWRRRAGPALLAALSGPALSAAQALTPPAPTVPAEPAPGAAAPAVFFDDFSYPDAQALQQGGWQRRSASGLPGLPGATWSPDGVSVGEQDGQRVLRLSARTQGLPENTQHAQLCHQRKFFEGSYATRIRFTDQPLQGPRGDTLIQAFYAISPLRHDFDPLFSEIDWEYLPNGGWGSAQTRLYATTWQTVRLEPWLAYNQAHEEKRSHEGWQVLLTQVADGQVKHFLNGRLVATHGGRHYPAQPMALQFNLWFAVGGLLPAEQGLRRYAYEVDWVYYADRELLSPQQVEAAVAKLRQGDQARVDTVPTPSPALDSPCAL
jgi:hypothetical protein